MMQKMLFRPKQCYTILTSDPADETPARSEWRVRGENLPGRKARTLIEDLRSRGYDVGTISVERVK